MSRSRNKVLGHRDRDPYNKKLANRKYRKCQGKLDEDNPRLVLGKSKSHRFVTDPYDICDWKYNLYGKQDAIRAIKEGIRKYGIPKDSSGMSVRKYIERTLAKYTFK